jgi:transposase InsO family protein
MGVHVAPTYFQRVIAGTILAEFMFNGMEMYIDDIIVYGDTEEELLQNLEKLFKKCAQFNLTLNPDKCKLGLTSIEYVGHILDKDGVRMSNDKIRKVLEFPLPTKVKHLQAFLGLANYFRDHIKGIATMMAPLYEMTTNKDGKKGSRVITEWTDEAMHAFEAVKTAIEACPRLYFFEDEDPKTKSRQYDTIVETDASDYGIGAYLYQRKIGETMQRPIAFISKSLSRVERRWSTIEKEQYAIFYALKKWEHLLRGIHFTLRTDHDNLRRMNDGSPKVVRWKLALQEFNCTVEHVPGPQNHVADPLSRLVDENIPPDNVFDDGMLGAIGFETIRIPDDKCTIISEHHNAVVGHLGVRKTLKRMHDRNIKPWVHMRQHVKKFIRECPVCQKASQTQALLHVKPYVVSSTRAWERISMDTIGPIKVKGCQYEHILVIIDNFSRFVTLYPCVSTDAEEAAKHLLHHIGTFGLPDQIMSDEGSQFVNDTLKYLAKRLGVNAVTGIAYSKQENAIVERANKEVLRHLQAFIFDKNVLNVWVDCLPMVQRIMNASVHESTGLSPAQIIFGHTVDLDNRMFSEHIGEDVSDGHTTRKKNVRLRSWIDSLWTAQQALVERAEQTLEATNKANLSKRAPKGPITQLEIGSLVLCRYPETAMGHKPPTKLHLPWQGPFQLMKANGPDKLTIRHTTTGKDYVVHISRLKPYLYDPAISDPRDVARRDDQETFVERVLSHEGEMKRKKTLRFHVKYIGFPITTGPESFLPWSELRRVEALHEYLEDNGLEKYIPKNLEGWDDDDDDDDDDTDDNETVNHHDTQIASSQVTVALPTTNKRMKKRRTPTTLPDAQIPKRRRQRGRGTKNIP